MIRVGSFTDRHAFDEDGIAACLAGTPGPWRPAPPFGALSDRMQARDALSLLTCDACSIILARAIADEATIHHAREGAG